MSFKDTQSYKELQADWRWIHSMDPEAAAAADQWVKEHPEEWKELEHMLYYSEANFHKRVAPDTLEDVDIKQPRSYNPEAFLPEEVRNAIYDDMRWFDRAKYLPEGSDEDPLMYVRKEIDEGLHELTELQREIPVSHRHQRRVHRIRRTGQTVLVQKHPRYPRPCASTDTGQNQKT